MCVTGCDLYSPSLERAFFGRFNDRQWSRPAQNRCKVDIIQGVSMEATATAPRSGEGRFLNRLISASTPPDDVPIITISRLMCLVLTVFVMAPKCRRPFPCYQRLVGAFDRGWFGPDAVVVPTAGFSPPTVPQGSPTFLVLPLPTSVHR